MMEIVSRDRWGSKSKWKFGNMNSERFDTDSMHSTAALTDRITINTPGVYCVFAHVNFQSDNDYTQFLLDILVNGTTGIASHRDLNPGATASTRRFSLSTIWKFAAADFITFQVLQVNTSAGAATIPASNAVGPEFGAVWAGVG